MKNQTLVCPSVQMTHKCQGISPIWVFAINRPPFTSLRLFLSHHGFCPTLCAIPLDGGNTEGREQERAAGVTAFWAEHIAVQAYWCGGDRASFMARSSSDRGGTFRLVSRCEEGQSEATRAKTGLGS